MARVTRFFVGVDLHKTVIQVCVMDRLGEIIEERRYLAKDLVMGQTVLNDLMRFRDGGRFAVEAIGVNRWFVNGLLNAGADVVVCDPTKLNLKMLGRKTDRRDAQEIARRLMLGDIDLNARTYYPNDEQYGKRKVLRVRHRLVELRQQLVNQVRSMLNAYKITGFSGSILTEEALCRLPYIGWPTEEMAVVAQALATSLRGLTESINQLEVQLQEIALDPQIAALKRQLPYVGPVTAAVLYYELGEVARFVRTRAVASYAGLVPRVNQSADKAHHGRLTKRGNRELRHVMGEWAVRLLANNPLVQQWAAPRLNRSHKNKVRMALSRRLLIGVYKMLQTGEAFSMERCLGL